MDNRLRQRKQQVKQLTTDIVIEFTNTHLKLKGHDWKFTKQNDHQNRQQQPNNDNENDIQITDNNNDNDEDERILNSSSSSLKEICKSLNEVSNELQEFIKSAYNDQFIEMTTILFQPNKNNNNDTEDKEENNIPGYEAFRIVADELFSQRILWSHIVTFLVFGAELSCRAIEKSSNEEERYNMVSQIIIWMCTYINENLLQWITKQDGGWMSIKNYTASNGSTTNKGVKHYFGMAAFVVFVGSLYLCSKFSVQP